MHESEDDSGKDNYEPSDDKVIALMTIVVIAVTRGRLERKQRRMCAHSWRGISPHCKHRMSSDSPADKSNPNGTQPGDLPLLVTEIKPSLNPVWGNKSRWRNPRAETSLHWQDVLTQTCSSNVKPNLTTSCYWLKWWVAGQVHSQAGQA